jgi:hypothetical protein
VAYGGKDNAGIDRQADEGGQADEGQGNQNQGLSALTS